MLVEDVGKLKRQLDSEGYVILRSVFSDQLIEGAKEALNRYVDRAAQQLVAEGRVPDPFEQEPFETRLFSLFEQSVEQAPKSIGKNGKEFHDEAFFALFFNAPLVDLVEVLLGPEIRLYPNYLVRCKFPQWEGHRVLWHQDAGYTAKTEDRGVEALPMVNVWAPLVPAREANGCMQFVPGTHKLGILPHEVREHYLEIRHDVLEPLIAEAVSIELDPGDVVLFQNLLLHQGLPNRSGTIRWSADWRYEDAHYPTYRAEEGHVVRSRSNPDAAVRDADEWARLSFR